MAINNEKIIALRATIGRKVTGDPSFNGSALAYKNLLPNEQITLTRGMAEYIRQNPAEFSAANLATANTITDTSLNSDYTIAEGVSDFAGEVVNQIEEINPLSERNRGKLAFALFAGAVILGGFYIYLNAPRFNVEK